MRLGLPRFIIEEFMLHDVLVSNLMILVFVSVYPMRLAGCFGAYFMEINRVLVFSGKKSGRPLIAYDILG
jgi:hypothetical protein